jgi:hypothetical protein
MEGDQKLKGSATSPPGRESDGVSSFLVGFSQLLKALVFVVLLGWALLNIEFIKEWLSSLSGGELFGFKFERGVIDQATSDLERLANQSASDGSFINKALAQDAILRAARVAPTIVDSRLLWVDDGWKIEKQNNDFNVSIVEILRNLKIHVDKVSSTDEAMNAMRIRPYDVVISNAWRSNDPENRKQPLKMCKVHYFDFPDDRLKDADERTREITLDQFNRDANMHSPAGFSLADIIISSPGDDGTKPDVILFAARTAEVASSLCNYTITNRGDVLLNTIVSILEQRHAAKLSKSQATKK